ncbi:protein kinase domain-containing protein [Gracilibacillus sp. D59]|uniref:protein kinase domain-containing protein n=1 Tax=Gracilibacillus sp. D59 TaxID=3457434 RepID=UPI003FCE321D
MEVIRWIIKKLWQTLMDKTFSPIHILANRYKVEKVLGEGSYGIVYLCWDLNTSGKCVVKQMRKSKRKENETMYKQETAVLSILNHPSIPKLMETFTYQNNMFFAMEFIDGENLEDLLFTKKKQYQEKEALLFFKELLEIVQHIHKKGVAHGDIRIPNVIMNNERLFLIDFGLSQNLHKKNVQDDFYDLGDFLLFILYSTYDAPSKKNQPWTKELNLQTNTTCILKKLLQIEEPYQNVNDILQDVNHAISDHIN